MASLDLEEHPRKRVRLDESTDGTHQSNEPPPGDSELEKELRAGITEYVSPDAQGFSGTLKQRYVDFLVNEILPSGEILHLNAVGHKSNNQKASKPAPTQPVPAEPVSEKKEVTAQPEASTTKGEQSKETNDKNVQDKAMISENDVTELRSIFGEKTTSAILSLHKATVNNPNRKPKDFNVVKSEVIPLKEQRTSAHQTVRRIFSSRLETVTESDETITIKAATKVSQNQSSSRASNSQRTNKLGWEELGGEYLHFTLCKENKDTMEVVHFIGSQLKSAPKAIQFAGTKDRRGVTVQRISAKRVHIDRLARIGGNLRNAYIGDFEYQPSPLALGDLQGNEFTITLRDCHFPGEEDLESAQRLQLANATVSKSVNAFRENGFINYYGLQRFGTFSSTTDAIGMKMLKGDLKGAVDDILHFSPTALAAAQGKPTPTPVSSDDKARAEALHMWNETSKCGPVLQKLPRKFTAESNLVRHLGFVDRKSGTLSRQNDYQGALMNIPRNLRLMYVHAYQSLVWNAIAGERWKTYGSQAVEGDLILIKEQKNTSNSHRTDADEDDVDQAGEVIIRPSAEDSATAAADVFERARPLTKEEAESGQYTIFDIVLPLPGYDVEYPANAIGKSYETFMKSERGGGLDPYDMRRSWKDISLSGGYRKLMSRSGETSCIVQEYTKDDEHLVETNIDRIKKGDAKEGKEAKSKDGKGEDVEMAEQEQEVQKKIAVVLKFQLGSSQYATMALRELMKAGGVKAFKPEYGGRN